MIDKVEYKSVGSEMVVSKFPDVVITPLYGRPNAGHTIDLDTVLYAIERSIAEDFSTYYTKYDNSLGVTYEKEFEIVSVMSSENIVQFLHDKLTKTNQSSKQMCIRYISGDSIRVIYSPENSTKEPKVVDLTKYSNAISDTAWLRLVTVFNRMADRELATLDTTSGVLTLNMESNEVWSKAALRIAYLILAEAVLADSAYTKYILLSVIASFTSAENYTAFFKALSDVTRIEQIFYIPTLEV